jgi:hypothetical protein
MLKIFEIREISPPALTFEVRLASMGAALVLMAKISCIPKGEWRICLSGIKT